MMLHFNNHIDRSSTWWAVHHWTKLYLELFYLKLVGVGSFGSIFQKSVQIKFSPKGNLATKREERFTGIYYQQNHEDTQLQLFLIEIPRKIG